MVLFKSIKSIFRRLKKQSFTFHYGPIQMAFLKYNIVSEKTFTFHYGPIQIRSALHRQLLNQLFTFHYGPIQMIYPL